MFDVTLATYTLLLAAAITVITIPVASRATALFMLIAKRPVLACVVVGILSLLLNSLTGMLVHFPIPTIRDEFSYLLAADTFSQGRLTNPTHPMWPHFFSEHIIHEPSYQSKYPPGQAIALAFGQIFLGHPITGVWISLALASAAVCWMLQTWLPKGWAFLGGLLVVANVNVFALWGQTYWGGGVAMLGGALLFGSFRRLVVQQTAHNAIFFSIGLAILANSRPFEGLIASIPVGIYLIWHNLTDRTPLPTLTKNLIGPSATVLLPVLVAMGYYNWAVTGHIYKLPYQVWMEQRGISVTQSSTGKIFSSSIPDASRQAPHKVLSEWERRYLDDHRAARRPIMKFYRQYFFYIGLPLTIPFLFWPMLLANRWVQFAAANCVLVFAGIFLNETAGFAHYAAPIAPLLMYLTIQGMRFLRAWRWQQYKPGQLVVRIVAAHAFVFFTMFVAGPWRNQPVPAHLTWGVDRARLATDLIEKGGKHLVMVRYSPRHYPQREWVYNGASIDDAPVVWAKELGEDKDTVLFRYFSDRKVWRLAPDEGVGTLTPFDQ